MSISIRPLAPNIGAEIEGLDLSRPIPDEDFEKVRQAFYDHAVIAIRGSVFDDSDHIRFSSRFGELKKLKYDAYIGDRRPEIFIVSNIRSDSGDYIGAHDAGIGQDEDLVAEAVRQDEEAVLDAQARDEGVGSDGLGPEAPDRRRRHPVIGEIEQVRDRLAVLEKTKAGETEALGLLAGNGNLVKRPFLLGPKVGLVGFNEAAWTAALQG